MEGVDMPYAIRRKKDKFVVYNSDTMEVKGTHNTRDRAENQMRFLYSLEEKDKKRKR